MLIWLSTKKEENCYRKVRRGQHTFLLEQKYKYKSLGPQVRQSVLSPWSTTLFSKTTVLPPGRWVWSLLSEPQISVSHQFEVRQLTLLLIRFLPYVFTWVEFPFFYSFLLFISSGDEILSFEKKRPSVTCQPDVVNRYTLPHIHTFPPVNIKRTSLVCVDQPWI
jgi:hypothetical protein